MDQHVKDLLDEYEESKESLNVIKDFLVSFLKK